MSLARCLPSVYDLLYPLLDEKEKVFVARTIKQYAQQSYDRLKAGDFCQNPGQSHLGRLPSYLGEAVLVLKDSNVLPREGRAAGRSIFLQDWNENLHPPLPIRTRAPPPLRQQTPAIFLSSYVFSAKEAKNTKMPESVRHRIRHLRHIFLFLMIFSFSYRL